VPICIISAIERLRPAQGIEQDQTNKCKKSKAGGITILGFKLYDKAKIKKKTKPWYWTKTQRPTQLQPCDF
jgi:hypothetical protein